MIKKISFSIILLSVIFLSCRSSQDNPMTADPNSYYTSTIQPIFNQSCASSGCHSSGSNASGVNLSSYDAVMNSTGREYGSRIVIPGDADASPLIDVLGSNRDVDVQRMPIGSSLSESTIQTLRDWVNDGATDE